MKEKIQYTDVSEMYDAINHGKDIEKIKELAINQGHSGVLSHLFQSSYSVTRKDMCSALKSAIKNKIGDVKDVYTSAGELCSALFDISEIDHLDSKSIEAVLLSIIQEEVKFEEKNQDKYSELVVETSSIVQSANNGY